VGGLGVGSRGSVIYTRVAMPDLLDLQALSSSRAADERLARAELRRQIGRLERDLSRLSAEAFPRLAIETDVPASCGEPRVAGLEELERVRDALAARISGARQALRQQGELELRNRELLGRMLDAPAEHKWVRISRADLGEPGCGHWHSRPRLGPLGMLMGWWRVKVSSGCPLAGRLAAVDQRQTRRRGAPAGTLG
jgi:hypothetical protein